ncbi:MAG: diphosphate--fructose-6-phosphate 1-phosphotransferase [Candidatus Ratteibacteria bacterium]|jgi:6-phosphofructokinase 1
MKNAVIAQSGGPTAVINNSIRGAVDVLKASGKVGRLYGARMGIIGVLQEELLDITEQSFGQVALLAKTPSAGVLGSCRYKIKSEEDLNRVVEVFAKHDVGYFFYCGGNDSMDTADKINNLAKEKGLDLVCAGIAKTIDNDVGGGLQPDGTFAICDHNPGYGSTVRSLAVNILEANQENKASYTSDPVLVIGVMGRKIGFITAGARLADPERKMPLVLVLPEAFGKTNSEENLEYITRKVNEKLEAFGRCIVVVSEGANLGDLDILRDSFGHEQFSGSGKTTEGVLANYFNGLDRKDSQGRAESRLKVRGIARSERPGTKQRREIGTVSEVDLFEAYQVGAKAARIALEGEGGFMATIIRAPGLKYQVAFDKVLLKTVANAERKFPAEWIAKDRIDVTEDFIKWALPLLGGPLPVFADFKEVFAPNLCGKYIPFAYRK